MNRSVAAEKLIEIYKTPHGAVYQSNLRHQYILDFGGRSSVFKVRDFSHFQKQVKAINLDEMVSSCSRTADVAILISHCADRCFLLTLNDVLHLQELLAGAKFMINLNSMISECLQVNIATSYLD